MDLSQKIDRLPTLPGCYLFRNSRGEIIYVGKAVSLRHRVRSYFQAGQHQSPKTRLLRTEVADLEVMLVDHEVEALILEQTLIKQHRPRFNVLLKDDKHYPYLHLTDEEYPRLVITRRPANDGRTFGPYPSAGAVRETQRLLRRLFPLRSCSNQKFNTVDRPCLLYHIHRCAAPCQSGLVSRDEYDALVRSTAAFLSGKTDAVVTDLKSRMQAAAEAEEFERAAELRDRLVAVERVALKQKAAVPGAGDRDVIGLARLEHLASAQIFFVRGGEIVGRRPFFLECLPIEEDGVVLAQLLSQVYPRLEEVPPEILLPAPVPDAPLLEAFLAERRGRAVRLVVPRRGQRLQLVGLVVDNAKMALEAEWQERDGDGARRRDGLLELAGALDLSGPPRRIECFDISTFQGAQQVASMTVMEDGVVQPNAYRRFKIRGQTEQNDFAALAEATSRRFKALAQDADGMGARPDLLVIDGGRGQLSAVHQALEAMGLGDLPTVGLAKREEVLFRLGQTDPLVLGKESKAMRLLRELRDEAHRFAITYHRALRHKAGLRSVLDEVPGIGAKRKAMLLKHFGSVRGVLAADLSELVKAGLPERIAEKVRMHLIGPKEGP